MAQPTAWIGLLTFNDGTNLELRRDDLVVLVGPNNAGKSAMLRDVQTKLHNSGPTRVVRDIQVEKDGSFDDLISWLRQGKETPSQDPNNPVYTRAGIQVHRSQANSEWNSQAYLPQLGGYFCYSLTTEGRLAAANAPQSVSMLDQSSRHPVHAMYRDDALEARVSSSFQRAFGVALIVNRAAGSEIPLHFGVPPKPELGEDRVSLGYVRRLQMLPTVHGQGDGIRAYAGILLHTLATEHSILLLDEPEAFLHPPQIRQLARTLATELQNRGQIFVATHSSDFLSGIVDAEPGRVRVVRIRRDGDINPVRQLNSAQLKELWGDPLLRYSNILDGVFHELAIITEGDADCRFYAAVLDAARAGGIVRPKDIMFAHCGGKGRLPMAITALRALGVPVAAIADFDVLSDENPLRSIIESLGGCWSSLEEDWRIVKAAVDHNKPDLKTEDVRREIDSVLEGVTGGAFPEFAAQRIKEILRRSSPWSMAKRVGTSYIPAGEATVAYERLEAALRSVGLFVVEVGELEGFCRAEGQHGPSWVNAVLRRDLRSPEFDAARRFVSGAARFSD